ncbi:hypothetical protein FACS189456_4620 [Bacteroidia bacterium]|nr:hypothetical protein FACS189456_4620 [Bacteroidia bacterium]
MKKVVVFCAALAVSAGVWAQTQITYSTHGLQAGDVHETRTVTYQEPLNEGANIVWDFSNAAVVATEGVFAEALGSGANGKNIAVTNSYGTSFSFNLTPTSNEYFGYTHKNYSVVYDQPIVKTRFPQAYLDHHAGEFAGHINAPNSQVGVDGNYSTTVDAYGTIILTNGVTLNDVVRVKTTEAYKEHYPGADHEVDVVKYLWYSADLRYPVFVTQIYNSKMGDNVYSQKTSHVSIAALNYVAPQTKEANGLSVAADNVAFDVYPNPVKDVTNITYKLVNAAKVSLKVFDINGQCRQVVVNNEQQSEGNHQYTYAPATGGTYFVVLEIDGKRYTEQIVKK